MRFALVLFVALLLPSTAHAAGWQGSFDASYRAASPGEVICVPAGSYGVQTIPTVAGRTTPNVVFQGCGGGQVTVLGLVVGSGSGGDQPCCVTFKDMAITGSSSTQAVFIYWGNKSISSSAHDVTFDNVDLAVGQATRGAVVEAFDTLRLTIKNSRIGPACCGRDAGGGSPVGIRLGTADRVALGWPPNTDAVIDHNVIKGITRLCSEWLNGYGPCPSTTCPNAQDLCHEDAIQVYGATNLSITRNRIYHVGINGIFLDSTDPTNGGLIENNMIGDIMRGATCFDIDGRGIYGTWNVNNNTCAVAGGDGYYVGNAAVMQQHGAVWNWRSNVGALFISQVTTPSGNCTAGTTGVFFYSFNVFSTDNAGATNCGGNTTVGDPQYVNTALAPADNMDLALAGPAGVADNKMPPACYVAADINGLPRPQDPSCDIGADERKTSGGPPPLPKCPGEGGGLTLTKLSETATTITLGWQPQASARGYWFSSSATPGKYSTTNDGSRTSVKFAKASCYLVQVQLPGAAGGFGSPGA